VTPLRIGLTYSSKNGKIAMMILAELLTHKKTDEKIEERRGKKSGTS
jgi:hypothetical protein